MKILCSSDIHGHIMPYLYADNKESNLGFLKMLTTMKKYLDEDTIVIDNGDTIQGSSLLNCYHENIVGDDPMSICLNTIYDYVNVGNHDFNYGVDYLVKYLNSLKAKCITANVFYKGKRLGEEYVIHNFKDTKVGIIGVTTSGIGMFERSENLIDVEIKNAYEMVKEISAKIKNQVAKIVVVYHGGFECDFNGNKLEEFTTENEGYRMLKELDIDILISGHQHQSIATKFNNKIVSQCQSNAKEFVLIENDEVKLIPSDSYVDEGLFEKFKELENHTQKYLDQVIGEYEDDSLLIKDDFDARYHKHKVVSFLNEVALYYSNADLAANALFNNAKGFKQKISIRDVVSTYIYPNTLDVIEISGKDLKRYLEKNAEYFSVKENKVVVSDDYLYPVERHFNYDMVDGIDYVVKVSNQIGKRIISMKYHGKDIKEDDTFTLAINNFRYAGSGGFSFLKESKLVKKIEVEMSDLIIDYLQKQQKIKVNHVDNIMVIK